VALCAATGCATAATATRPRPLGPALYTGSMAQTTRYERTHRRPGPDDPPRHPNASVAVFATSAAIGAVGVLGAIGFGIAGAALNPKLDDGFDDGLSVAEEDRIRDRGALFNDLALGFGVAGLVGLSVAAITYGVDYTRCGKLAPKGRGCDIVRPPRADTAAARSRSRREHAAPADPAAPAHATSPGGGRAPARSSDPAGGDAPHPTADPDRPSAPPGGQDSGSNDPRAPKDPPPPPHAARRRPAPVPVGPVR